MRASARRRMTITFLIHGEGFGSIAGKVKTCFSRAFPRPIQPLRGMEPDELFVSTRSAGPDDSHHHPAVAAATASPGARRYLAAGSVLYPGRSSGSPLLSPERVPARVPPPYLDGWL